MNFYFCRTNCFLLQCLVQSTAALNKKKWFGGFKETVLRILFWVWTWLFRWRIKHCKKKHFWNAVSGSREEKFSSVWTLLHQFRSFVDRIYKYVFIKSWNVHIYFESLYLETFFSLRLSEFSCTFENLTENRGWKLYFLYGNDPKNIYIQITYIS